MSEPEDDEYATPGDVPRGEMDAARAARLERIRAFSDAELREAYAALQHRSLGATETYLLELEIEIRQRGLKPN